MSLASDLDKNNTLETLTFFRVHGAENSSCSGIYNSTGQLLKGRELFEKYTDLAKQLDTKRSAFYLELKEHEIVFGCSLTVKAENGREERVVFIHVNKNLPTEYNLEINIDLLREFYQEIKIIIENLEFKKYKLVGLWNEGDFLNIQETPLSTKDPLEYTLGKILDHKKVYIKISELSAGLSFVLELIPKLKGISSYVFDVSYYPSESNVSISLIKPNPDFELQENGKWQDFIQPKLWNLYRNIGEESLRNARIYSSESLCKEAKNNPKNDEKNDSDKNFHDEKEKHILKNKVGNQEIKNQEVLVAFLIQDILHDPSSYSSSLNSVFDDLEDKNKVEILKGLIQKRDEVNLKSVHFRKILLNVYQKTKASEQKYEIHKALISQNIYGTQFVKDLIISLYQERDTKLLNLLFSSKALPKNTPLNHLESIDLSPWNSTNSKNEVNNGPFEKGIKDALESLESSDKVIFIKFIANNAPSNSRALGIIFLETLIKSLVESEGNNDFILELSNEEAERLDKIFPDGNYLETKMVKKRRKRIKLLKIVVMIVIIPIILFLIWRVLPDIMVFIKTINTSFVEFLRENSNSTNLRSIT